VKRPLKLVKGLFIIIIIIIIGNDGKEYLIECAVDILSVAWKFSKNRSGFEYFKVKLNP
jgi:hypothetical protein